MRLNNTGDYDTHQSDGQRLDAPDWKEDFRCAVVCAGCRCHGAGVDAWECVREFERSNSESRRLGRLA